MSGTLISTMLPMAVSEVAVFSGRNRNCGITPARTTLVAAALLLSRIDFQTVTGLGLLTSIWYFLIASATFCIGSAPSSANAFSAAIVT